MPEGLALLIPLLNPRDVVFDGVAPSLGEPLRLDLDGRGVRALEPLGEIGYLVVAGGPATAADRVYLWSGLPDEAPILVAELGLNVEGLALHPGEPRLLLVSDDGTRLVRGVECKRTEDVADRGFRSLLLELPSIGEPSGS